MKQKLQTSQFGLIPKVDPRTELLGIVFYLAGNPEYNCSLYPDYKRVLNEYFASYAEHPAVRFAKKLREQNSVAYDAPMAFALSLSVPPKLLPPLVAFSDKLPEPRFGKNNAEEFASLLVDFCKTTKFSDFFDQQSKSYGKEELACVIHGQPLDAEWFESVVGNSSQITFKTLLYLAGDGSHYAHRNDYPDGRSEVYAIVDKTSNTESTVWSLLFSVIFDLVEREYGKFEAAAEILYNIQTGEVRRGPAQMIARSTVDACLISYFDKLHDESTVKLIKSRDCQRGWDWVDGLVRLIDDYRARKKEPKNFVELVPEIADYLSAYSKKYSSSALVSGSKLVGHVDERTELLGIVFYLAGNSEYQKSQYKDYVSDIDQSFGKYKDHPAIAYAKELHLKRGVGYNAPMDMALALSPPPHLLPPLVEFTDVVPENRFGKERALEFAKRLESFYKDADFHAFFEKHANFYREEELASRKITNGFDEHWFEEYFGKGKVPKFDVIILMTNDGGGYGPHNLLADGSIDSYAVLDKSGDIGIVVHEFLHTLINPIVDKNAVLFGPIAQNLSKLSGDKLPETYRSSMVVVYESLVRALEITYLQKHGLKRLSSRSIRDAKEMGMDWMDDLCVLVQSYSSHRKPDQRFEDFLPEIVHFFNEYLKKTS